MEKKTEWKGRWEIKVKGENMDWDNECSFERPYGNLLLWKLPNTYVRSEIESTYNGGDNDPTK